MMTAALAATLRPDETETLEFQVLRIRLSFIPLPHATDPDAGSTDLSA